eukprot:CAMPEP_0201686608 /NCGR_PEP_ID=MMETSP0578-20130828/988_1 /ASSEMBLY_ACC=CAM_ASM_000663 /TAXON_ID=267565 /ORGANISM="Skeletonema grethea, Strain CCMP 1804" /LENGTH=212 /DNA_ID=CAMNT_0048170679 /DNA_START=62 /DNA_END=700 /DNA_ORIENTATION=-
MTDLFQEELLENWPSQGADSTDSLFYSAEKAVRRETLLENWPKRKLSTASFDSEEEFHFAPDSNKRRQPRSVRFSETSQLRVYERQSMYLLRSLAYTKEDRSEFGKAALLEGFKIRRLITSAPPESTTGSIKFLLDKGIINRGELVGLEHFYLDKPTNVVNRRKRHAAAVLWKQQELQHQQLDDQGLSLGKFAQSSSRRSTQRARIRAAMAA